LKSPAGRRNHKQAAVVYGAYARKEEASPSVPAVRIRVSLLAAALVVNLFVAGFLTAPSAYACSCAGTSTVEESLRTSDAVFSGEVVGLGAEDPEPRDDTPLGGVEFRVKESWKGVSDGSVIIYGQGEGYFGEAGEGEMVVVNSCAVTFEQGESYLVYAYRGGEKAGGHLETDICTATKPLSDAGADLRVLDATTTVLPDTGGPAPLRDRGASSVAVVVLIALAGTLALRRWVRQSS
jgi:hypothetical protein